MAFHQEQEEVAPSVSFCWVVCWLNVMELPAHCAEKSQRIYSGTRAPELGGLYGQVCATYS